MVYGKWYPSWFGARVAAGGADCTSGVGAAGTVARIDLRVLRPPTQIKPPLLPTVRPLRSLPGLRPLSLRINTLATRRPLPYARRPSSTAPVRCVRPGYQQRARERPRPLRWAACPGTGAAQRLGALVTTWCPVRAFAGSRRHAHSSLPHPPLLCTCLLPQCGSNACPNAWDAPPHSARAQFADEAPSRPSVSSRHAPPTSTFFVPSTAPTPSLHVAAYLGVSPSPALS